jgi:hypothetical protein
MHRVVKITCPVSDDMLDAACARAAKKAGPRTSPKSLAVSVAAAALQLRC